MKKVLALLLSMAMIFTALPVTAFAADEAPAKSKTQMKITMLQESKDKASICDALFAEKADLEAAGDDVLVKLYVAFPVPGFPQLGTDGTLKDVVAHYNGAEYAGESDITTKPSMITKTTNPMFGTVEGAEVTAQTITFKLPKEAIKEDSIIQVDAYVNVVMNTVQTFRMKMNDVVLPENEEPEQEPALPEYAYGPTEMDITMLKESKDAPSICDALFAEKADLVSDGEDALVKLYVTYPVPGFPQLGADGTLKDVVAYYDGNEYAGESDITTKPLMTTKTSNPMFGIQAGQEVPAQVITFRLPKEALKEQGKIKVDAYVNVMMDSVQSFRMLMTNVVLPEADKTALLDKISEAEAEAEKEYTEESLKALKEAITHAEAVAADRNAEDSAVTLAVEALDSAIQALEKEGTPEPQEKPDYKNLEDGVYVVQGKMLKPSGDRSMSDDAINHNIKLTVKDGRYSLTMNFKGLVVGDRLGYLGELEYFLSGYKKDKFNAPTGKTAPVTVEKIMTDKEGNPLKDQYGTDYPDVVTFEMIPEALEDGMVPLQVNVPLMDSIAPGLGLQQVYLALDWSTVKTAEADDEIFNPEEDEPVIPEGEVKPEGNKEDMAKPEGNREEGGKEEGGKTPVTGDAASLYFWFAAVLTAAGAASLLRRKNTEEK